MGQTVVGWVFFGGMKFIITPVKWELFHKTLRIPIKQPVFPWISSTGRFFFSWIFFATFRSDVSGCLESRQWFFSAKGTKKWWWQEVEGVIIPKTHIFAPENGWQRKTMNFPLGAKGLFSGAMLVFREVLSISRESCYLHKFRLVKTQKKHLEKTPLSYKQNTQS